ncbi:DUF6612 family protein [Anaerotignum propionicum]|uniref:Lipoprotein n=1 Tax=Anaerotignum propionicum DSM 1682 TaxID=991789 RepID=A0A0X8VAB2_ANAPI|nr:DUF6612 family protein [Anaerotignum propionicum]AMJ40278.1 hypothetical protein CPRO_06760 [Anaerotignum propionicum DSM 1682]SHE45969.1 hypothetical protein SAMN02745151_00801 [[Clostridium] propionicum DSM 1682] [Anaerotignum propionicum DSM 1682]
MKHRLQYFLFALTLLVAITGCSSKQQNTGTLIETAQTNMSQITSLQAKMNMVVNMTMGTEKVATATTADITAFIKPLKMKIEIASRMESSTAKDTVMEMYLQENNSTIDLYTNAGTGWFHTQGDKEKLGQFEVYDNILSYLSAIENPVNKGTEKIGNISTQRLEGTLKGEVVKKIVEESGILSSATSMGISEEDLQKIYDETGGLPITLWIGEDGLVYQYKTDISKLMQVIMEKTLALMGIDSTKNGNSLSVEDATITMTCSEFNSVKDFDIPKEILETKK